ncbi:MAG TPA: DUF3857 domain-containing protein [Pyrinomonadaceae bacterium]|nr:DUF3857 domain-containing protein [Pyrinomonadaceae bacterium]
MSFTNINRFVFLIVFCLFSAVFVSAQDKNWRPVAPVDLQSNSSVVEPNADAEAIFWEVRVDDSGSTELALNHYVRVKIYTDKGRDDFSKKDIVFLKGTKIKDVEARVTKPDGSTTFLKKEDVLEREIVKANGLKVKAKSFALPNLEAGSIVEYRYKEVIEDGSANMRLIFQRDIPIRNIAYYVKPYSGDKAMYSVSYNLGDTKPEKDKDGFYKVSMNNVSAFREEPDMIPEDEARSWMYIYYSNAQIDKPQEYWKSYSQVIFENAKSNLKPNDDVKKVTAEVIAGATTDDEKLHKIFDYCKTQIKNLNYTVNASDDEWKKVREAKTGGDVLKLRMGSADDIDTLFGTMARAAGFDARVAVGGNRNEVFFNPRTPNFNLMVNASSIAVKVGQDWRFFSPASRFAEYGMLGWGEEDEGVMISDSKELIFKKIPLSASVRSIEKKSGKFKLLPDGTLEGEVQMEFTGHRSSLMKLLNYRDSDTEREKTLKDTVKSNILGTAEIENVSIENVSDPAKPFIYRFKVRVPNYASRTGKRLFFQPNVFERNSKPRFTATTRKYDVYFNYPWSEEDDISIELPEGFELESADAPNPLKDSQGISSHETTMQVTKDGKTLFYKRKFSFGNGGLIRFPAGSYQALKGLFEAFNQADMHQLTLRQSAAPTK